MSSWMNNILLQTIRRSRPNIHVDVVTTTKRPNTAPAAWETGEPIPP